MCVDGVSNLVEDVARRVGSVSVPPDRDRRIGGYGRLRVRWW